MSADVFLRTSTPPRAAAYPDPAAHPVSRVGEEDEPSIAANAPRFLDRVRWHLRVKRYSLRTEKAYLDWIRRYILFHGKRHPAEMAEPEVAAFLSHLAVNRAVAASTQNQALSALLFFYSAVLKCELKFIDGVAHARRPAKLPVVLTRGEVRSILAHLRRH